MLAALYAHLGDAGGQPLLPSTLLRIKEVEARTGVPEATLRYWRYLTSAGTPTGPASFKLGRRVVWDAAECDAWIAEQRRQGVTGGGGSAA